MSTILFEKKEQVGIIRLNRPDKYNSFNREMALELQNSLDKAREAEEVRALLLTGSGKAFCAGQDLQEVIDHNFENMSQILLEQLNPLVLRIREMGKPVVCAVNGVAAGAGANIALACDLTLAGESAAFIQAFSKIGLIPDTGGTFTLPRLVGRQKAMALMLLGNKVSAAEAEQMGMIYRVVADEKLEEEAFALARSLASMPTIALGLTKKALNQSETNDFQQQLSLEERLQNQAGLTEDFREGVRAFIEKRKPKYRGK
jgi:2-(1,2-epoxy-1,2-dihydrophenyl)acetyl-CoA isomerase